MYYIYIYEREREREREKESNCVDASVFPSGLKAAAIVDLGGGCRGQYLADICSNDPDSTLCPNKD